MALKKTNTAEPEVKEEAENENEPDQGATSEVVEVEVSEGEVLDQPTTQVEEVLENREPQEVSVASNQPPAKPGGKNQALDTLAQSGFSGLKIDWTSFPTVVLDNGEFCTADGSPLETKEIFVRLVTSRSRYVYRTNTVDDDDAELAYTYDPSELNDPESELAEKVAKWKEEEGLDFTVKEYVEAAAVVVDENSSLNENMVLLQIPPTSIAKFSGYATTLLMVRGTEPDKVITRCYAGAKITKAKKPFVPWAFEFSSMA